MLLTKFTHACVRVEADGGALVVDPGAFSEAEEALAGVGAVLITHEHADHVDAAALHAALERDSALHVWAPPTVAADYGDRATSVAAGESFQVAGFTVSTYGGQHAVIHPLVPMCANVGFHIAAGTASIYHPGDSFAVPTEPVSGLLLPTSGPWMSAGQAVDFAVQVRAPRAYQVHDALLSELGGGVTERIVGGLVGTYGVELEHLAVRASVEV
jgi:L-ascorbate metabolism protein UlaG (beta-lactamase superfamily)